MRILRSALAAVVGAGLLSMLAPLTAHAADVPLGVALYENGTRLGRFNVSKPSGMTPIGGTITGLDEDDYLVGIDRRVQNGRLYGVGDEGGIYLMSSSVATKVGQLSIALNGDSFAVDFNPAANALRVLSDEGQNLRQPFSTGNGPTGATVADATLNYLGVTAVGITAAAYTNNDLSPSTATTLFDIDSNLDQVVVQSPANSGNLVATGKLGTGASVSTGIDIHSDVSDGTTVANYAFATVPVGTSYRFHSVDLLTGDLTYIGRFPTRVTDIALDIDN